MSSLRGNGVGRSKAAFQDLIFLSYAEADRELAITVSRLLLKHLRIKPFMAGWSVDPTRPWLTSIEGALRRCLLGIVLVTPQSRSRPWVLGESLCLKALKKEILPIVHGVKPKHLPDPLRGIEHITWNGDGPTALISFLRAELARSWIHAGAAFIEHLHATRPLVHHDDVKQKFYESKDHLISRHFVRFWHAQYCQSLLDAAGQTLPLPSSARMAAAIEAIHEAKKEVRAVAIVRNDIWVGEKAYLRANVAAKRRDVTIRRVFVMPTELYNAHAKAITLVIEQQLKAGFKLRYLTAAAYRTLCDKNDFPEQNLLICDARAMTTSSANDHTGRLSVNRSHIDSEIKNFEVLWQEGLKITESNAKAIVHECTTS